MRPYFQKASELQGDDLEWESSQPLRGFLGIKEISRPGWAAEGGVGDVKPIIALFLFYDVV